jgi:hypothetical protein
MQGKVIVITGATSGIRPTAERKDLEPFLPKHADNFRSVPVILRHRPRQLDSLPGSPCHYLNGSWRSAKPNRKTCPWGLFWAPNSNS